MNWRSSNQDPDDWRDQAVDREREEVLYGDRNKAMSEKSKIQWTDSTGGPWLVCSEVSPGCLNCYARELAEKRLAPMIRTAYRNAGFTDWQTRAVWGNTAPRVLSKGFWSDVGGFRRKPWICEITGKAFTDDEYKLLPDFQAGATQFHRRRIFPSLIDWLDDMPAGIIDQEGNTLEPVEVLALFLKVIFNAGDVTWILCTKRPENFYDRTGEALDYAIGNPSANDKEFIIWLDNWRGGTPPPNVILLTTVEGPDQLWRMDELRKIPAACRGISFEPLLAEIIVPDWTDISWAILGGESGPGARGCHVEWIDTLKCQAEAHDVYVFVKQFGALAICHNANMYDWPEGVELEPYGEAFASCRVITQDRKGGDVAEFPEQLRSQEWPKGF